MKILFLVPYPTTGASNRFRVEQYIPYLRSRKIECTIRPFISRDFYSVLYVKGSIFKKLLYFLVCTARRALDLARAVRYDLVFIHRESYPLGPPVIERVLRFLNKKMIFDFDDAIFLPASSGTYEFLERFKRFGKVPEVISLCDLVIAGNRYLADFAVKYNENVSVIPTPVDTDLYKPAPKCDASGKIVIGWIGSKTTSSFLEPMKEVFERLLDTYPSVLIRIVGGDFDMSENPRIEKICWTLEDELRLLQGFDIGIMPMPDTKWTRGKCAFKTILYMSVGIPCVSSHVGMNTAVIQNGVNGFLAGSPNEWKEKLSKLIESPDLRASIGAKGRQTIIEKYSLRVNASKFLATVHKAY